MKYEVKYEDEKINLGFKVNKETGEKIAINEDFAFEIASLIRNHFVTKKLSAEVIELIADDNTLIDEDI